MLAPGGPGSFHSVKEVPGTQEERKPEISFGHKDSVKLLSFVLMLGMEKEQREKE